MITPVHWQDIIDILIISIVVYKLLEWLRGTRAIQLIRGIIFVLAIFMISSFLELHTINWLLHKLATVIILILIIVFQPELRQALERLGRGRLFSKLLQTTDPAGSTRVVGHLIKAVEFLSENKIGALMVIERTAGLNEFAESGIPLDSMVTDDLLTSIFMPNSALHDGAVIIQGSRLLAASCLLPLSESDVLDTRLGTRHRAAIGITEKTDAVVIIVSEETGIISLAEDGALTRYLTKETLEERLFNILHHHDTRTEHFNLLSLFSKPPKNNET